MSELTLIGLGAMGSALGHALLDNQFDLTIWNRSPEKTSQLQKRGAKVAASLLQAIEASPRVMLCVTGYAAAQELFSEASIASSLNGKTIIQLSTGTPGEVRAFAAFAADNSAQYLDGSIMVYPETIGQKTAQILVSGNSLIYQDAKPYLNSLGGDVRYIGENIGAAAALDLAVLSRLCVITPGVLNGVNICLSEGVPLTHFAELYPEGDRARSLALSIHHGNYAENILASVNTAVSCLSAIKNHCEDLGISSEIPAFSLGLYQRALDAGLGDQDAAALIDVLRKEV